MQWERQVHSVMVTQQEAWRTRGRPKMSVSVPSTKTVPGAWLVDGQTDGWVDGQSDEWMDGHMDRRGREGWTG